MKIIKLITLIFLPILGFSQLVNDGGTITIEDGATLFVESDVTNQNSGAINLNGTGELHVQGHLDIQAGTTFSNAATSKVKFVGTGDSHLTSNGVTIENVEMAKTSDNLILNDNASVNTTINFVNNGKIVLGTNTLTLSDPTVITGAGAGKYIQADGTGKLVWNIAALGSKKFEIGDTDDYSPLTVDVNGTTVVGATNPSVAVGVEDLKHTQVDAGVTDFISRNWSHLATDMTTYQATVTGEYTDADVNGTEADIKGASYDGAWAAVNATGNAATNMVGVDISTDDVDITGMKLAQELVMELKVFLQGPFSGGMMGDALRAASPTLLPTNEPYTALGYAHVGTGGGETIVPAVLTVTGNDAIVDWVVIELRDMAMNTDVLATKSVLIQRDGDIVDLDGTSPVTIIDPTGGDGMFFIAVRHRNHLGFMSANALALSNVSAAYDFTNGTIPTYGTNALKVDGGVYMMWGGDTNGDGFVYYNAGGNDRVSLLNILGNNLNGFLQTYNRGDVNMDGFTYYNAGGNDRVKILNYLNNNLNGFIQNQLP